MTVNQEVDKLGIKGDVFLNTFLKMMYGRSKMLYRDNRAEIKYQQS